MAVHVIEKEFQQEIAVFEMVGERRRLSLVEIKGLVEKRVGLGVLFARNVVVGSNELKFALEKFDVDKDFAEMGLFDFKLAVELVNYKVGVEIKVYFGVWFGG